MSRARTFADLATASEEGSLASPNMIQNGDMAVSQRATSLTSQTGTFYCVDRFKIIESADAVFSAAQSSTSPEGFNNSLKIDTTTADSSLSSTQYSSIVQNQEGLNLQHLNWGTSNAKPLTVSFHVRSNVTGTYCLLMVAKDATVKYQSQTYTIDSANTWEKKVLTYIGETTTAIPDDNSNSLWIEFCLGSGTGYTSGGATGQAWSSDGTKYFGGQGVNIMASTDNEFLLTGVQMEVGRVATPFKYESYGDNLKRCQRYYYVHSDGDSKPLGTGVAEATAAPSWTIDFPTSMRTGPSILVQEGTGYYTSYGGGSTDAFDGFLLDDISINSAYLYSNSAKNAGGLTAGRGLIVTTSNASAKVAFDSVL